MRKNRAPWERGPHPAAASLWSDGGRSSRPSRRPWLWRGAREPGTAWPWAAGSAWERAGCWPNWRPARNPAGRWCSPAVAGPMRRARPTACWWTPSTTTCAALGHREESLGWEKGAPRLAPVFGVFGPPPARRTGRPGRALPRASGAEELLARLGAARRSVVLASTTCTGPMPRRPSWSAYLVRHPPRARCCWPSPTARHRSTPRWPRRSNAAAGGALRCCSARRRSPAQQAGELLATRGDPPRCATTSCARAAAIRFFLEQLARAARRGRGRGCGGRAGTATCRRPCSRRCESELRGLGDVRTRAAGRRRGGGRAVRDRPGRRPPRGWSERRRWPRSTGCWPANWCGRRTVRCGSPSAIRWCAGPSTRTRPAAGGSPRTGAWRRAAARARRPDRGTGHHVERSSVPGTRRRSTRSPAPGTPPP